MKAGLSRLPWLLVALLVGCSTLQSPKLPDNLATLANQAESDGDTAREAFVVELEAAVRLHERNGELFQAVQLLASGLKVLPDQPRLLELYQSIDKQLETARLYLAWEKLISETRQQLTEQELLRSENKLQSPSGFRDWQLERLEKSLQTNAEKLRQCALHSMENKQWHYAEDCLTLAAHIRGHDFVSQEVEQLNAARTSTTATTKTTNTLLERRLVNAFNRELRQNELLKARETLKRLNQLNTTRTDQDKLQQQLDSAIQQKINVLAEQAAEHYRNQEYPLARANWQAILELDPNHPEAAERLKRVDKVLQSLEELQSGADNPK